MKQFIFSNWYYIAIVFLAILNTLCLFCKKTKIVQKDTIFEQLLRRLPTMIRSVEEKGLTGSDKKVAVMTYAIQWLLEFGVEDTKKYNKLIDEAIEDILSTPQKKGTTTNE